MLIKTICLIIYNRIEKKKKREQRVLETAWPGGRTRSALKIELQSRKFRFVKRRAWRDYIG